MESERPFGAHRYIVVEGPIGVGKTTLVRRLAPRARSRTVLEVFEENPFLEKFYQERSRFAFQTELFFLLSRYRQQVQMGQQDLFHDVTLSDYLFHKNLIFSGITLEEDEWHLYLEVYEALVPQIPKPDLVVHLDASLPVLMERIARRGRHYEANMDQDYIDLLATRYRRTFQRFDLCPVLHIDTEGLRLHEDDDALQMVMDEVRNTSTGHRFVGTNLLEA